MSRVRPNGDEYGPFPSGNITEKGVFLRLARNEWESLQICVKPTGGDLRSVKVAVEGDLDLVASGQSLVTSGVESQKEKVEGQCEKTGQATVKPPNRQTVGCRFAASNITCSVVGYVNITNKPPYRFSFTVKANNAVGYYRATAPHRGGWWPDPILDFLGEADVKDGVAQSFWVRVHCPEDQPAGVFRGTLVVSAEGVEPRRIPLSVRVNDFTLGRRSALPLLITFRPSGSKKDPASAAGCWRRHRDEWIDFLADYFIMPDNLYRVDYGECKIDFETLERLKREGRLGLFNLGYWGYPPSTNDTDLVKMRKDIDGRIGKAYRLAKERGLLDHACIYGCDEIDPGQFHLAKAAADYLKASFPEVPVATTARDNSYGVGTPLASVDWFTPFSTWYKRDQADKSRAAGHKVWWYVCCTPEGDETPCNWYVDRQAIEGRLLMGAQAVRMRPDGFLYYETANWMGNKCIVNGPFTDWNPRNSIQYNGDGQWVCAGPDGIPLPTIRLENFRDGLEDYAYAKLLEEKLREMQNAQCTMQNEGDTAAVQLSNYPTSQLSNCASWAQRAREALAVPREVMDTMTNYTGDPAVVNRWRDEMADLIEGAGGAK